MIAYTAPTWNEVFDYYMNLIDENLEYATDMRNSAISDIASEVTRRSKNRNRTDVCFERNTSSSLISMVEYTGYIRGLQLALEALNALKKHKSEMEKEGTE